MEEEQIKGVMKILNDWNPLGKRVYEISDLDGYRSEAIDILFYIELNHSKAKIENIVKTILNEAFNLSLKNEECSKVAGLIYDLIKK